MTTAMRMTKSKAGGPGKSLVPRPNTSQFAHMQDAVANSIDFLRTIGSPHRLTILALLLDGEKTVSQICDALGARQSLVSQHLSRLRLNGLVCTERDGYFVRYRLSSEPTREIIAALYRHFGFQSQGRHHIQSRAIPQSARTESINTTQ